MNRPGKRHIGACEVKLWAVKVALLVLSIWVLPGKSDAHIGSPNVVYEGLAGPYHVRVIVRPPGVIPGLADINVRVLSGEPSKVTVLPVRSDVGKSLAPTPDDAKPVRGDPNLYSAQLWLMTSGAYSIIVHLTGPQGEGRTVVPVNSVATTRLPMPKWLGGALLVIASGLFLALVTLVGAAARESALLPGEPPTRRHRLRGAIAMILAFVILAAGLYGGRKWWNKVDTNYRTNKMYRPEPLLATLGTNDHQTILTVKIGDSKRRGGSLIPDHGKLMHLFVISRDMQAFAHLHPVLVKTKHAFESALPSLPAGKYSLYADVTLETGFAQTLTADLDLPNTEIRPSVLADPDDSWRVVSQAAAPSSPMGSAQSFSLAQDLTMLWAQPHPLRTGRESTLQFRVLDAAGKPAVLEPYLGMQAHAVLRHEDGSVFTHIHPFGTISMASQQLFVKREQAIAPNRKTLDVVCGAPSPDDRIAFPYEFPKPGRYRVWVQVKRQNEILTGCFDTQVLGPG